MDRRKTIPSDVWRRRAQARPQDIVVAVVLTLAAAALLGFTIGGGGSGVDLIGTSAEVNQK